MATALQPRNGQHSAPCRLEQMAAEVALVSGSRQAVLGALLDATLPTARRGRPAFRAVWVNEAMNRGLPVIASDAVGAAAGGLVRDRRNGLVVSAGDSDALATAIRALAADPQLRARLGQAGAEDVRAFTYEAWAEGFSRALASLELSQRR